MILETARLILRPFTMEDADFMVEMWKDPGVNQFIGGPKTPEQTRQKIQDAVEHQVRHGFARWAVTLKPGGELIGLCGPMLREIAGVEEVELGYAFPRVHWGRGYATEAAKASLEHCFTKLGHHRVVAIILPENHSSIGVILKSGMRFERTVPWDGGWTDLYFATSTSTG
jgi:ribosomal-protein-alanine N-acetyltransferase